MLAARQLLSRVFDAAGLALHNEVQETVLQLARAQGVRVHQDKLKIDDPVDVLKDVSKTPLDREVACLESVVTLLETDLAPMQARAQAWALGDVETLRRLPGAADRTACMAAVSSSERVRSLIARAQDDWLIAVEDSLNRNRGTLAVQSMDRLLGEQGALAALRSQGLQRHRPLSLSCAAHTTRPARASRAPPSPAAHCGTRRSHRCRRGSAAVAPRSAPTAKPGRRGRRRPSPRPPNPSSRAARHRRSAVPSGAPSAAGSRSARARKTPPSRPARRTPRWRPRRSDGPRARAALR